MMPWDDIQTYMAKMAQDGSTTALTFLKMMYNTGYKIVLTEFGRQVTEDEAVIDLENARRAYQVPPDMMIPKGIELIDGDNITPLTEVSSDRIWAQMKSGTALGAPSHYHYKPRFGVGGGVIEILPAPSGDDYDMRMVYEVRDKDLSASAYIDGTIALTIDDATVTGSGTAFTTAMVGRYLIPTKAGADALPYRIVARTSATVLELEQNYAGATDATVQYKIVEIPNLPDDMMLIPAYFALEQWWSSQGNSSKQQEFQLKWTLGMTRAKKTHANTTRDAFIPSAGGGLPFPSAPSYFPTMIEE